MELCNIFASDGPESGDVRLFYTQSRPSYYRGRVEVFLSETWGKVVGPWTTANADVVCHQLGYNISSECYFIHKSIKKHSKKLMLRDGGKLQIPKS